MSHSVAIPAGVQQGERLEGITIRGTHRHQHSGADPSRAAEIYGKPACLLPPDQWWVVWGALSVKELSPSVIVCAPRVDFSVWAGVLDVGGIELITEPYADDTLRDAFVWLLTIMRADLKFGIAK
jgi:hypothetical protein